MLDYTCVETSRIQFITLKIHFWIINLFWDKSFNAAVSHTHLWDSHLSRARYNYILFLMCFFFLSLWFVVCLLDIFLSILSTVMFSQALEISFFSLGQMVCISLLFFSFQCFYHLCKQLNQKRTHTYTRIHKYLATRCQIGAIVEFEMIPPWALHAEAQGFKQLQA